jgi:L-lactate dehydrogenase complex protein LldG
VVRTDQVVPGVPEAIAALDPRWPQLWVAGPADHDIELDRIDEVHHPECLHVLHVLLVDEAAA